MKLSKNRFGKEPAFFLIMLCVLLGAALSASAQGYTSHYYPTVTNPLYPEPETEMVEVMTRR